MKYETQLAKEAVKGSTLNYTHLIKQIQVKHQEIGIITTNPLSLIDTCIMYPKKIKNDTYAC